MEKPNNWHGSDEFIFQVRVRSHTVPYKNFRWPPRETKSHRTTKILKKSNTPRFTFCLQLLKKKRSFSCEVFQKFFSKTTKISKNLNRKLFFSICGEKYLYLRDGATSTPVPDNTPTYQFRCLYSLKSVNVQSHFTTNITKRQRVHI